MGLSLGIENNLQEIYFLHTIHIIRTTFNVLFISLRDSGTPAPPRVL